MTIQKIQKMGVRHVYVEYNNASALAFKRVWLTKKCEAKIDVTKLTYSGDGIKLDKYYGFMAEGDIETDADDDTIDSILFASTKVSPSGGDDFASRYVKGTYAEMQTNYVGLRITIDAEDADTGAPLVERWRFPKIQFAPEQPPAVQTQTVQGRMLHWTARRATTDIIGGTLTGVPTTGCFWLRDILIDPTKFDPVAEIY